MMGVLRKAILKKFPALCEQEITSEVKGMPNKHTKVTVQNAEILLKFFTEKETNL